jgi:(+)-trans-carveol dehydrogenase
MGRLEGKVAFITGIARGQGRSHAIRMAQEGARIVGLDVCDEIEGVQYPLATTGDLKETISRVEAVGGSIHAEVGDVRSFDDVRRVIDAGREAFGEIDVVVANAGITCRVGPTWELDELDWTQTLAVNLIGAWQATRAVIPQMIKDGRRGSLILISSAVGIKGAENLGPYVASKHGVIGLMRTLARELAPHRIRVNCILPGPIDTPILINDMMGKIFCPDLAHATREDMAAASLAAPLAAMPVPWFDPVEVSNAVVWLASDESTYVTGVPLSIDAGASVL